MDFLTYIFVFFAAIFNAAMDLQENERFFVSIFSKKNPNFWYKRKSWDKCQKIFRYKIDAWHLSKSAMIVFIIMGIVSYQKTFGVFDFLVLGILWNLTFNLFYNKIFYRG